MVPTAASSTVLVVDDEPANLKVLTEALSGQGFTIAVATSGERAIEQTRRRPPDVILLDAMMPVMDGFEVCRRLKAEPATESIPVIFMTALADMADRIRAFDLGAADFLTKPFHREELRARVKTQLHLRYAIKSLEAKNAELEQAREASAIAVTKLEQLTAELMSANQTLDDEVSRRTQELLAAKEALEEELQRRRQGDAQREALQKQMFELSSPIIPISDRVLIMPLIGIIDEERAQMVVESALRRIATSGASVMILDITGVPSVNARVASAILDTAAALRLLGAKTLLTGIRPEVARILMTLEVDFSQIDTHSTLQAGIVHAMRLIERGSTVPKAR